MHPRRYRATFSARIRMRSAQISLAIRAAIASRMRHGSHKVDAAHAFRRRSSRVRADKPPTGPPSGSLAPGPSAASPKCCRRSRARAAGHGCCGSSAAPAAVGGGVASSGCGSGDGGLGCCLAAASRPRWLRPRGGVRRRAKASSQGAAGPGSGPLRPCRARGSEGVRGQG